MTVRYSNLYDGIIKYGQTVVFFPNLKTPLMDKARRFIHLTPHDDGMRICEIEVHSYNSGMRSVLYKLDSINFNDVMMQSRKMERNNVDCSRHELSHFFPFSSPDSNSLLFAKSKVF